MELPLLASLKVCYAVRDITNIGKQSALLAYSNLQAYRPCHQRDSTAGTLESGAHLVPLVALTLSVTTTGRMEKPGDGPHRHHSWGPSDSHESAVGLVEAHRMEASCHAFPGSRFAFPGCHFAFQSEAAGHSTGSAPATAGGPPLPSCGI